MDYIVAGIASILLFVYLVYALLSQSVSEVSMTQTEFCKSPCFFLIISRADEAAGHLHGPALEGERTFLHPVLGWLERLCYRLGGVNENVGAALGRSTPSSLLAFSIFSALLLYLLQRVQGWLPLNRWVSARRTP